MGYLLFIYKGKSRDLRKIIVSILKSGVADNVKKINYVQDYSFENGKIEKKEEKVLLICTQNQNKLLDFLSKNFSQIEKINLN